MGIKNHLTPCLSSLAKDFICKLLVLNPSDRFTAEAALKHPWITGKDDIERSLYYPCLNCPRAKTPFSLRTIVVYPDDSMDESVEENDCMDTNTDEIDVAVEVQKHNNRHNFNDFLQLCLIQIFLVLPTFSSAN